ncbi:hypothetical protein GCM10007939_20970 [Amylibacter marinus]|uniref:Coenzyme PQQ synthesis protein D (PqqD) n=1 Tax=Amylibacter marinus TaxID=1475483 RepID=A0ABQ5VWY0_9RHOB|nr:PqqD family peptide modification chaperone [Amylibacter marinus]GLQ35814.1 hypothetical protein GCM10007939_20970 [Amylibacter marinus]
MDITETTCITKNEAVLATELDGEFVMMDIESGAYYSLAGVSADIWEMLEQGPKTLGELEAKLLGAYDIDAESCRRDVVAFIGQMADAEVVALT